LLLLLLFVAEACQAHAQQTCFNLHGHQTHAKANTTNTTNNSTAQHTNLQEGGC
jgi:hypothetical protein